MSDNAYQLIRYSDNNLMQKIELSLADPLCKTLFGGIIDSVSIKYRYNPLDVEVHVINGVHTYALKTAIAETLWFTMFCLGQFVHCAAYDFNPFATRLSLPNTITLDKLLEINMEAPSELSRVLARYKYNPLLEHFLSIRQLCNRIILVQEAIERGLEWIGRALEATLERGLDCSWNWGALWGIEREEFVERIEGAMVRRANDSYAKIEEIKQEEEMAMILHPTESSLAKHIEEVSKGRIMVSNFPNTFNLDFDLEDSSVNEFLALLI